MWRFPDVCYLYLFTWWVVLTCKNSWMSSLGLEKLCQDLGLACFYCVRMTKALAAFLSWYFWSWIHLSFFRQTKLGKSSTYRNLLSMRKKKTSYRDFMALVLWWTTRGWEWLCVFLAAEPTQRIVRHTDLFVWRSCIVSGLVMQNGQAGCP